METTLSANQVKFIMDLIRSNKSFRKVIMNEAKEIYADIVSFTSNANCSCKKRVGAWIQKNSVKVEEIFQKFKKDENFGEDIPIKELKEESQKQLEKEVKKEIRDTSLEKTKNEGKIKAEGTIKHVSEINNNSEEVIQDNSRFGMKVAGQVVEIEPDPENYKSLIKTSQKEMWIYKGLSMMETYKMEGGEEKTVWLVFFY